MVAAVADSDPDRALIQLLDQYIWVREQRSLLERLHELKGARVDGSIRCFLIAPRFTHAFLNRLTLLSIAVTPFLARAVRTRGGTVLAIEPAAPIFGQDEERQKPRPELRQAPIHRMDDRILRPEPPLEPEIIPLSESPEETDGSPVSDLLDDLRPLSIPELSDAAASLDVDPESSAGESTDPAPPATPFEPLSTDELEEFHRFEQLRRDRGSES